MKGGSTCWGLVMSHVGAAVQVGRRSLSLPGKSRRFRWGWKHLMRRGNEKQGLIKLGQKYVSTKLKEKIHNVNKEAEIRLSTPDGKYQEWNLVTHRAVNTNHRARTGQRRLRKVFRIQIKRLHCCHLDWLLLTTHSSLSYLLMTSVYL